MNETEETRIYVRMTQREKKQVGKYAAACGLPMAEYVRKRALGYSPKAAVTDAFYTFYEKLCELCNTVGEKVDADTETALLTLVSDIQRELLLPEKARQIVAETEAAAWRLPDSGP